MSFQFLSSLAKGKWLINPKYAEGFYPLVVTLLSGNSIAAPSLSVEEKEKKSSGAFKIPGKTSGIYLISDYGAEAPPEKAPDGSIAVMQIQQVITKYDQECGPSGTLTKNNLLKRAGNNPNIKAVILYCDSGGGEADGTEQFANTIREVAAIKPVIAFVDGMAASAMYWITSSCTMVIANLETAEIGSIGTYVSFADLKPMWEAQGVKFHEIYATKSTEKNKVWKEAL